MKSDLHDIEVTYQTENHKAVCVRGADAADVWLPKSACEIDGDRRRGGVVTLTAPERLLIERGLV